LNILFIHEIDWLRKVVFEIHTLSELLSCRGHRVYAIDYESMWKKERAFDFGSLKTRSVDGVSRAYPDASVSLIRPGFIKIPGISRFSAWFTQCAEIRRVIEEKDIDVIILYSVPTNGMQALHYARNFGIPVVFRSIDILNRLVKLPVLSWVTRFLERRVYSRSDLVLTISPRLSRYVTAMAVQQSHVRLLPLGVDTELFRPDADSSELCREWGIGNGPVIVFIGTLYDFSGLDGVIRQLPEVVKSFPDVKLLVVGDGPQRSQLERIAAEVGMERHLVITGFQPYETMPQYINMAAVCINPFLITDTTRDIFPTKIVQYMACARPVIATRLPGLEATITGEKQGVIYVELAGIAGALLKILGADELRRKLGRAALHYIIRTHSYETIVQQLEAELVEVVDRVKSR
jgi:glycosyltransferase involved in cell wall biosynthesis